MSNKSFESLRDVFDLEETNKVIEETITKKNDLKSKSKDQKYVLDNYEYLKSELQDLTATNRIVLQEVANSCKMGAPPSMFEVYATLSTTISKNIMDLAKIEQVITDYQVTETKEDIAYEKIKQKEQLALLKNSKSNKTSITQNNTYNYTSKELLKELISVEKKDEVVNTLEEVPDFNLD